MLRFCLTLFLSLAATALHAAGPGDPIITDSRIKTFVYNENDVYPITTLFGYQSNIEFGLKEEIETISLGDRIGWQIIPSGRRLFIRAMAENLRTNMTVVTSRRAYQFDLRTVNQAAARSEELVYVARFFYPDDEARFGLRQPGPPAPAPVPVSADALAMAAGSAGYNYNYTFSGPDGAAPLKIFDDGSSTYLKLRDMQSAPTIALVRPDGGESALSTRLADGYIVVPAVAPRLSLRQGASVVCIFNEAMSR